MKMIKSEPSNVNSGRSLRDRLSEHLSTQLCGQEQGGNWQTLQSARPLQVGHQGYCAGEGPHQGSLGKGRERVSLDSELQQLLQGHKQKTLVTNCKKFIFIFLSTLFLLVFSLSLSPSLTFDNH